jgi:aminoglycoside/choline kinase family phosphotransferase
MPSDDLLQWAASACPEYDPAVAPAPHRLPAAGSDRRLYRLFLPAGTLLLVANPCPPSEGPNENDSFVYVANHLRDRDLPAPEVHAYDRELGAYLIDDLDDDDLYGKVRIGLSDRELRDLYRKGIALLARMQVAAAEGLDTGKLHSPPRYDRELMRAGESGYFQREFLEHHLGFSPASELLLGEYELLADRAARAGADFFLHRDYQSTNLKLYSGELWVIDFQGARLGPPQYDLAAFLFDPYVELPAELREELMAEYLEDYLRRTALDRARFLDDFPTVALHRLMQALGAYAFLGRQPGKNDFLAFIPPALRLIDEVYRLLPAGEYPAIGRILAAAREHGGQQDSR